MRIRKCVSRVAIDDPVCLWCPLYFSSVEHRAVSLRAYGKDVQFYRNFAQEEEIRKCDSVTCLQLFARGDTEGDQKSPANELIDILKTPQAHYRTIWSVQSIRMHQMRLLQWFIF